MAKMLIVSRFNSPIGGLSVTHDEQYIYQASFTSFDKNTPYQYEWDDSKGFVNQTSESTKLLQRIASELTSYFFNPHHRFQLQLSPNGSPYQMRVWNSLLVIPSGRTLTYGELASRLQSSPRAIGQACKKNPLVLFIPCHRVVGKDDLGGYMGSPNALPYKLSLLKHEGLDFSKRSA
jgi:methylated-DNA-[protein]-cysteine S-methyltransferase